MALCKEIEKSLRTEDAEVDAVEDHAMKDSVLEMASADFKEQDVLYLPLASRKRVGVDVGADYPGKSVSRKKYGLDVGVSLEESNSEDEVEESELDSDTALEDGLMGLDDESAEEEEGSEDDEEEGSDDDVEDEDEALSMEEEDAKSESAELENETEDVGGVLKVFSSSSTEPLEIQKGLAVREQLRIWESLLENRIKLEPGLVAANQLYQHDKMKAFVSKEKSSGSDDINAVYKALQNLTSSCCKLQEALGEQAIEKSSGRKRPVDGGDSGNSDNESIRSSEASEKHSEDGASDDETSETKDLDGPPRKKPKSNRPPSLDQSYADFAPFRDAEITKWNEKAKISSGKAAQKDFSAFDQSILKLIESILFDKYRLVRKTQLKRADYVIYGKSDKQEDEDEKEDGGLVVNKPQNKKDQVYDPEIFDDGDFYQKLLRDFIDGKSSDGGIPKHERKLMELHRLRIKMKRKIDTRATKGRKLRYVVHPKLVNYMAPVPSNSFSAEAETQLLKSLFGQTLTSSA